MKEKKNILAVIMSLFMILSLLPVPVSAAELTVLDGKLKIQGTAMARTGRRQCHLCLVS